FSFKAPAPRRDLLPIARCADQLRSKEDEVVGKGCDQRHSVGGGGSREPQEEKGRRKPGKPLHLHRQNEKNVNYFLGIEAGKGKKKRRRQHRVGKLGAEKESRDRGSDHSDEKIEIEAKGAPRLFQAVADKKQKPKDEQKPKRLHHR